MGFSRLCKNWPIKIFKKITNGDFRNYFNYNFGSFIEKIVLDMMYILFDE